jgi:hypothetical protein
MVLTGPTGPLRGADMDAGTGLVVTAGTLTFGNEWFQTGKLNWRVPIATLLAAGAIGGVSKASPKGSAALGVMVLIGALVTPFHGKAPIGLAADILNGTNKVARSKVGRFVPTPLSAR